MIVAIDPGTTHSAVVQFDEFEGRVVDAWPRMENCDVGSFLFHRVATPPRSQPLAFCCEWIESQGMAVGKETFQTVYWIGRFAATVPLMYLVPRRSVKLHLCGSMRAKDANVSQAIRDKIGGKGTKSEPGRTYGVKSHAWQALAVAVTFAERGPAACIELAT